MMDDFLVVAMVETMEKMTVVESVAVMAAVMAAV